MLFVLSDELLPHCVRDSGAELEGVQNLLLAARKGQHAISGKSDLFVALSKNEALSVRERAMALSLANRRTELPILERMVKNKVVVHANYGLKSIQKIDCNAWHIHANELRDRFLSSSIVLAENIIDAELYQYAARHYQIDAGIKSVVARSNARGGGGSQIDVELRSLLSDGFPVVAITDGDCGFPNATTSVISRRCNDFVAEQRGIGWHVPLSTREIENLIPLNVLCDVCDPQLASSASDTVGQIIRVGSAIKSRPEKYVCFKRGTNLQDIFKMSGLHREYWLDIAERVKATRPAHFSECLQSQECALNLCNCVLTTGFGDSVLNMVKAWLSERSLQDSLKSFQNSEVWMSVGEVVFDISIAFRPSAT